MTLWFFLPLFSVAVPAMAADNDISDSFSRSFEVGCVQSLVKKAVADYSRMTGIGSESISAEVRSRLEAATRPLDATCKCLSRKASAMVQSESEKKMEIAVDLSGLSNSAECSPEPATANAVQREFLRLVEASPPPISAIKAKRAPFTLELTLNKARPSVFASYTRPPDGLTKLVFLAPFTGTACDPQNVCVDRVPLEIVKANELLATHSRVLGREGAQNLQKVIDQYGGSARVITSGSNFSNFATTAKGATYAIRSIDGVSIERTKSRKVWLTFFASQVPTDPRSIDFLPAIVSIFEVEFVD